MNKHRCPVCNKFMYRDEEDSLARGSVVFKCPDDCKTMDANHKFHNVDVIDVEATTKFWQEINKENGLPLNFGLGSQKHE